HSRVVLLYVLSGITFYGRSHGTKADPQSKLQLVRGRFVGELPDQLEALGEMVEGFRCGRPLVRPQPGARPMDDGLLRLLRFREMICGDIRFDFGDSRVDQDGCDFGM